jgi:hypothetical protein
VIPGVRTALFASVVSARARLPQDTNAAYAETHFCTPICVAEWPESFAIISAYATTGASWIEVQTRQADTKTKLKSAREGLGARLHAK